MARNVSRFKLLTAGLVATSLGALALAQDMDPFAGPADPFAGPADPFMAPAAPDPFAAPAAPDPFAAPAAPDPFAAPMAPDPFAGPADPFAGPADPFAGPADPFAGPADPFAGPADPFAAPAAPVTPTDPFAAPAAPFTPTDPFAAPQQADPFAMTPSSDPFAMTDIGDAASDVVNPDGIDQLYQFRYERFLTWDGRIIVRRRQLTLQDARRYDELRIAELAEQARAGELENYQAGGSPEEWAEWAHFAEQLHFWSQYVDRMVLAGTDTEDTAYKQIQWPGQPAEGGPGQGPGAGAGGGPNDVYAIADQSLDDQLGGLVNPFAGGGATGPGGGHSPYTIIDQIVTVYGTMENRLRDLETEQERFMRDFQLRLDERRGSRIAYYDWREEQQQRIVSFVMDWERRTSGQVMTIGGMRYELYRPGAVPENLPGDATVIITDYRITPYDLLNPEDGTLRRSTRN